MKFNLVTFKNWLYNEREAVSATSTTIADNITALFEIVGMIVTPALPASVLSVVILFNLPVIWPLWTRIGITIITATTFEAIGITAAKGVVKQWQAFLDKRTTKQELVATVGAALLYIAAVILVTILGRAHLPAVLLYPAMASPILAAAMYMIVGINTNERNQADKQNQERVIQDAYGARLLEAELEDKIKRLEMERLQTQQEFENQLKVKRLIAEAKLQAKKDRVSTQYVSFAERVEQAKEVLKRMPTISGADLARKLDVDRSYGPKILHALRENEPEFWNTLGRD
jgi:hypothetical protein